MYVLTLDYDQSLPSRKSLTQKRDSLTNTVAFHWTWIHQHEQLYGTFLELAAELGLQSVHVLWMSFPSWSSGLRSARSRTIKRLKPTVIESRLH